MTHEAKGTFEVRLTPQPPEEGAEDLPMGRLTIEKTFEGDLVGTSRGQMLAVRSTVDGSAGYVAMEIVSATLAGRTGSFALQHSGTMNRGVAQLVVGVVPDSGTEGLAGLGGEMTIEIVEGKHEYGFRYLLGDVGQGGPRG